MQRFIRLTCILTTLLYLTYGFAAQPQNTTRQQSDRVITQKITSQFAKNAILNALKLSVTTHNGLVTLKGRVNNKKAFVEALQLIQSTKGVRFIDVDQLEIKPENTRLADAYITAKVETAILKAKVLDDESIPLVGINATTENGIVHLSGSVKHQDSIKHIIKRVSAVKGVKKVLSNLSVAKSTRK